MRSIGTGRLCGILLAFVAACETSNGASQGKDAASPRPKVSAPDIDPTCLADPEEKVKLDTDAKRDFDRADAAFDIGVEMSSAGNYPGALEALQRAVKLDPMHGLAQLELAKAHLFTDNDHHAMYAALGTAVQLLPTNPRAHTQYAQLAADSGASDVAIRHWRCALSLKPSLADARYALARQYLAKGKPILAEEEIRSALKGDEANAQAHVLLGDVLEAKGEALDAARSVETAAKMVARSAALYRRAGSLYEVGGDEDAAVRVRTVADRIDPPKEDRNLRPLRKARKRR